MASTTYSPTTRDAEHAVAPTTKTSVLHSLLQIPSTERLGFDGLGSGHRVTQDRSGATGSSARSTLRRAARLRPRRRRRKRELAERGDAILSCRLGSVERLVARPQQRRRRGSVEGIRRDASGDPERKAGVGEPLREEPPDLGAECLCEVGVRAREHHDELVAAETGRGSAVRERAAENVGHLLQQRVAELVPCSVVDLLEVVAVDDKQAQRHPPLLGDSELAFQPLLETAAIEDSRERIGHCAQTLALERESGVE